MRKTLYAEFTANPGHETLVKELLHGLVESVRAEPGNLVFDVFTKEDEPSSFFVFEVYADDDAFRQHLGSPHSAVFNSKLTDLVKGGRSQLTWLTAMR